MFFGVVCRNKRDIGNADVCKGLGFVIWLLRLKPKPKFGVLAVGAWIPTVWPVALVGGAEYPLNLSHRHRKMKLLKRADGNAATLLRCSDAGCHGECENPRRR